VRQFAMENLANRCRKKPYADPRCGVWAGPVNPCVKSSIRSMQSFAFRETSGSSVMAFEPVSKLLTRRAIELMAIQGQAAQDLQVAPDPPVGAGRKVLWGARAFMRCMMPLSVADERKIGQPSRDSPASTRVRVVEATEGFSAEGLLKKIIARENDHLPNNALKSMMEGSSIPRT